MEDFLKFLLIAGVILVGIFKEVSKITSRKRAQNKRPVPPTPSPVEVDPDATPIPEFWGEAARFWTISSNHFRWNSPLPNRLPNRHPKEEKRRNICSRIHSWLKQTVPQRSPTRYYLGRNPATQVLSNELSRLPVMSF